MADASTAQPRDPEQPGNQQPSPDAKDLRQSAADPQREAEGNPALRRHHAVARRLIANGISAVVEYPGCVVIELDPETTVWTGLESWAYGTVHRLRDGIMHDTDELAEPGGVLSSRKHPKPSPTPGPFGSEHFKPAPPVTRIRPVSENGAQLLPAHAPQSPAPQANGPDGELLTYTVTIDGPVRQTSNMIWDFSCYAADPDHAASTVIAYLQAEFSDDMGFYPPGGPRPQLTVTNVCEGIQRHGAPHYREDIRHQIEWRTDITGEDQAISRYSSLASYTSRVHGNHSRAEWATEILRRSHVTVTGTFGVFTAEKNLGDFTLRHPARVTWQPLSLGIPDTAGPGHTLHRTAVLLQWTTSQIAAITAALTKPPAASPSLSREEQV